MKPLQILLANAAQTDRKIVLSEGTNPRVVHGALAGGADVGGVEVFDPAITPLGDQMAHRYHALRQHKGISRQEAVRNPHVAAALLVRMGLADGTLGGAVATTADIVRTALQVIGTAPETKIVSSFFLMLFCKTHHQRKGAHVFSDAGLVVDPDAAQMAEIACASARSFGDLINETPRVAMLSFSTRGSARHSAVSKVVAATDLVRRMAPDLMVDGELQFHAAFIPEDAQSKAADSPLRGNANVFIFPNLESGNIAYKIAQRNGGAVAIGPVLSGLDRVLLGLVDQLVALCRHVHRPCQPGPHGA